MQSELTGCARQTCPRSEADVWARVRPLYVGAVMSASHGRTRYHAFRVYDPFSATHGVIILPVAPYIFTRGTLRPGSGLYHPNGTVMALHHFQKLPEVFPPFLG